MRTVIYIDDHNKRWQTADNMLHISDLPTGFIVDVSAYLTKPSRAILAVAFSAPSTSWQNDNSIHQLSDISTAIVSASQWDILDFEDVDKDLAMELSDDDISAVLKCINAQDVLKRLKLCGCLSVNGYCLQPLKGSVVLELLDLSFVGRNEEVEIPRYTDPKSSCWESVVIPILDSIIGLAGCSLTFVIFPNNWSTIEQYTHGQGYCSLLKDFRGRYNQLFNNRGLKCAKCNTSLNGYDWLTDDKRVWQNNICYDCLKPFCGDCMAPGDKNTFLDFCDCCEKDYCADCTPIDWCQSCNENRCKGCIPCCSATVEGLNEE